MAEIRKISPELATPIPGLKGVRGIVLQTTQKRAEELGPDELNRRFNGTPIILDKPNFVVVHYYEPKAEMHEHSAPQPALFVVLSGNGFLRLGGPEGETLPVTTGDAILWPANVQHKVWTEDEPLQALIVDYGN